MEAAAGTETEAEGEVGTELRGLESDLYREGGGGEVGVGGGGDDFLSPARSLNSSFNPSDREPLAGRCVPNSTSAEGRGGHGPSS